MVIQTYRQSDGWTERQTDRQAGRQAGRQTDNSDFTGPSVGCGSNTMNGYH